MKRFFPLIILTLILASCSTPKDIAYFQDLATGQTIQPQSVYDIRVRPEDKLSIIVSTQDAALSALLNLVQTQTRLTSETVPGHAQYGGDSRISYYTVDSDGYINFPLLGKLHIAGMKREEVAQYIERRLIDSSIVKDPIVTVEFINTGVAVLGEVARPGRYEFNRDRMTVVDALALAGDLKTTGRRDNVMVIRTVGDHKESYVIDLTDARSVAASPAFYLQQEDIVYVEPNAKAKRETTSAGNTPFAPAFWVSVGSLAVSVATMVITLTHK